jgi:hypothetical protein
LIKINLSKIYLQIVGSKREQKYLDTEVAPTKFTSEGNEHQPEPTISKKTSNILSFSLYLQVLQIATQYDFTMLSTDKVYHLQHMQDDPLYMDGLPNGKGYLSYTHFTEAL